MSDHPTDQARALDRAYFAHHPGALSYVRPFVPGECGGMYPPESAPPLVAVGYVSARMAVKSAVFSQSEVPGALRDIEKMADQLRGGAPRGVGA